MGGGLGKMLTEIMIWEYSHVPSNKWLIKREAEKYEDENGPNKSNCVDCPAEATQIPRSVNDVHVFARIEEMKRNWNHV